MPTPRRFNFVPMWGMAVIFIYFMRRVNCPDCGVRVEQVPWADGKCPVSHELKWFLAKWAKLMSWKEVASAFRVSWDRRSSMASRPQLSNARLPNRRRSQATALDWARPNGQNIAAVLSLSRQGQDQKVAIHLQRHVASLPQGDSQATQARRL